MLEIEYYRRPKSKYYISSGSEIRKCDIFKQCFNIYFPWCTNNVKPLECDEFCSGIIIKNFYGIHFSCIHYDPKDKDILIWLHQLPDEELVYRVANFTSKEYNLKEGDIMIVGTLPLGVEFKLKEIDNPNINNINKNE